MLSCERCGVRVLGSPPCCPLCQGPLTGEPDRDAQAYPDIPFAAAPRRMTLRLLALGTVAAAAACAGVLLCLPEHGAAALSGMAGLAAGWLMVGTGVKKRGKPLKAVFWQVCLLTLLLLAADRGTGGRGWSLDYALPALYTCSMLAMALIARLLRLRAPDYLLYLVLNILLGLVPLGLLLRGALRVAYPAAACAGVSVVLLAALVIFQGPALKAELLRRLHL